MPTIAVVRNGSTDNATDENRINQFMNEMECKTGHKFTNLGSFTLCYSCKEPLRKDQVEALSGELRKIDRSVRHVVHFGD